MKILHTVESYDPANHGMQQVVKQLSERLVQMGHQVIVATRYDSARKELIINGVQIEQFNISGKAVSGLLSNHGEIERYENFLIHSDFDIITNFAAQQWATDIALPILQRINAIKVFVPTGFSEFHNPKFKGYYESMKMWMKNYDINVFLSNDYQDINFAKKNGITTQVLIPNGASEEEFMELSQLNIRKELNIPNNHFLILHVGSHTGLKGHKDTIKIFKKANIVNATLLIIGNAAPTQLSIRSVIKNILKRVANLFKIFSGQQYFPACSMSCELRQTFFKFSLAGFNQNKFILIKDLTRPQTVAAYQAADVFLFPSNIECSPIVLFEAMASKTPFLTTDVGNAKEIIAWTNAGLLLPTQQLQNGFGQAKLKESAKILTHLFNDIKLREQIQKNGFDAWKRDFTWQTIAGKYEKLYESLLQKKNTFVNSDLLK